MSKKLRIIELLWYGLGTLVIALGVVLVIKSTLGTGPWDTLFIVLARKIEPLTIGLSAIIMTILLTALTVILRKDIRLFLMAIPIVMVGTFIDFFDLVVFENYIPTGFLRFIPYILGLSLVPLGGAMLVVARYPAGVFEELTLAVKDLLKISDVFKARMLLEMIPVIISLSLSWIWFNDFGAVNIGSLGFVFLVGPQLQMYLHWFKNIPFRRAA